MIYENIKLINFSQGKKKKKYTHEFYSKAQTEG